MKTTYYPRIANAINFFWSTKKKQRSVLAGKQLDAFLGVLTEVAVDAGVPRSCVYLKKQPHSRVFPCHKRLGSYYSFAKEKSRGSHRAEIAGRLLWKQSEQQNRRVTRFL